MKPFRRTLVITIMAIGAITASAVGQALPPQPPTPPKPPAPSLDFDVTLDRMNSELDRLHVALEKIKPNITLDFQLATAKFGLDFAFQKIGRAGDQAEREADRNLEYYRQGTRSIDDREYERAVRAFDRVIEAKSTRADGAYYWKAYALNKLGKRDEALAALAEIPKQFPQSRWISDAKALEIEVRQASGQGVSPERQSDEDLKLFAINALINSEPDRAIPLLEKLLNEAKSSPSLKQRALYVLAQSRSDKAREIVGQYAKSGSNPDLQLRAVEYLGTYRAKESRQTLADIYGAVNDINVKRAVLRSFMISHDTEHLLNAAKHETNPDLRRDAIRQLGNLQAQTELAQLYSTESNPELKETIIQAIANGGGGDKLIDIAKSEKDAKLRGIAINRLANMRREKSADALASMYGSESDKNIKLQIIQALWMQQAAKPLVDIARNEKDPELKKEAVHRLAMMKSKEATDYLMELLNK